jgi:hypothetical protein
MGSPRRADTRNPHYRPRAACRARPPMVRSTPGCSDEREIAHTRSPLWVKCTEWEERQCEVKHDRDCGVRNRTCQCECKCRVRW